MNDSLSSSFSPAIMCPTLRSDSSATTKATLEDVVFAKKNARSGAWEVKALWLIEKRLLSLMTEAI